MSPTGQTHAVVLLEQVDSSGSININMTLLHRDRYLQFSNTTYKEQHDDSVVLHATNNV